MTEVKLLACGSSDTILEKSFDVVIPWRYSLWLDEETFSANILKTLVD